MLAAPACERGALQRGYRQPRRRLLPDFQAKCAERFNIACGESSHRAVGAMLGLPGETVRRYRKGLSPIPVHVVVVFCGRFGIDPIWLIFGSGTMTGAGSSLARPVLEQEGLLRQSR
jgi:hypothetical protein